MVAYTVLITALGSWEKSVLAAISSIVTAWRIICCQAAIHPDF
jgi:hypothetical protein